MKKAIYEEYGIKVQDLRKIGKFDSFRVHQTDFLIVPITNIDEEEMYELYQLSEFMVEKREPNIARIVVTKKNNLFFEKDKAKYALVKYAAFTQGRYQQIGRNLARFHQKARTYPYQLSKTQRIGQWKYLWERRLDQLESFWSGKIHSQPFTQFEKMFIESFPYYLGLAENGIQYLVDTELDEEPQPIDSGTICHHRFHPTTWGSAQGVKLPTDWVFDHASRDIAEYLRHLFFERQEELQENGFRFLDDYDRTTPLSAFTWRLIYSRLLFPIHYFECVENYYLSSDNDKPIFEAKLKEILTASDQYELFLKSYSNMLSMRKKRIVLPSLEWLSS
ncbi:spore coat putative kinase YutH [uncultured Metabacillus sp.]|uniref:spore coat putative kinase YutH n=1 Tax=Metabacillus sp. Hm71 TaxID=3450743 RepID=UPI002630133F|nr:spore coat protein YutH [uncultured Metabacillus sp.]